MNETLLRVEDLKTWFDTPEGVVRAVDGVSFELAPAETLALLGESGCGKTVSALSVLRLVPEPAGRIVSGRVFLGDQDLLRLPEREMRKVRGKRIAMIFQEPQSSLDPVATVGAQIREALVDTAQPGRGGVYDHVVELLRAVGIADPDRRYYEYPHQLSGGMKQRVMIAMALAARAELLIADEPTTALDVTIQAQILALLKELQEKTGMAILLITHNLGVVANTADRVAVMYAGQIVESASRDALFAQPRHPYAQKLFRSMPARTKRGGALDVIAGAVPSLAQRFDYCRFADRCDYAWERCHRQEPRWIEESGRGVRCHLYDPAFASEASTQARVHRPAGPAPGGATTHAPKRLLEVRDLKVYFPIHRGVLQRVVGYVKAVDGVALEIDSARTLALVGESGCGKTTVGKGILQLIRPTAGNVLFDGRELTRLSGERLRRMRREFQVIFQDPFASLDPRMIVGEILDEGMRALEIGTRDERAARVEQLLSEVGLPSETRRRYPHEFSGGQRQRISIARALALEPKLLVCDEPTSALDLSVQAQILNLLKRLQDRFALSYLFITHDFSIVEYLAHEVAVMYLGRIAERGRVEEVLESPKHPYTRALLSAILTIEPDSSRRVIRLQGDTPSPSAPPAGCHFHPRCPEAMPICRETYPQEARFSGTHTACCHLYFERRGR
jgi:peptide/nickel transport system ATP-binding protein